MAATETSKPSIWAHRARTEYQLRSDGRARVLMMRYCDENGKDFRGDEALWRDVATIPDYNDASSILRHLRLGTGGDDINRAS